MPKTTEEIIQGRNRGEAKIPPDKWYSPEELQAELKKRTEEIFKQFDKHFKDWETLEWGIYEKIKGEFLEEMKE